MADMGEFVTRKVEVLREQKGGTWVIDLRRTKKVQESGGFNGKLRMGIPSGKRLHIWKIHNFNLENSLCLWPFSIANC